MKRFLFTVVIVLLALTAPRAQEPKRAGVTWWWQRTGKGIVVNIDVQDPEIIEVRAWAASDHSMTGSAAMVYGPGLPTALGMSWSEDTPPAHIWIEAIKAVGVENNPAENRSYGADSDAASVTAKFQ